MPTSEEWKRVNQPLIAEYRANGGQCRGYEDNPLLLLTTIGARTGQPRTTPLSYTTDGDRLIVMAAGGGAPSHPAWYRNLFAHPEVTVELGDQTWQTRATVAEGAEREHISGHYGTQLFRFGR